MLSNGIMHESAERTHNLAITEQIYTLEFASKALMK